MANLELFYVDDERGTVFDFMVESPLDYYDAFISTKLNINKAIVLLLGFAKESISKFGIKTPLPQEFIEALDENALDEFLITLSLDLNNLITSKIYIKLPEVHALMHKEISSGNMWISTGVSVDGFMLSRKSSHGMEITIATHSEVRDSFLTYSKK